MIEREVAYAAGLFDGEGSVGAQRRKGSGNYNVRAMVGMTDVRPLVWLQERWPGSFYQGSPPRKPQHAQNWWWKLTGQRAVDFLLTIRPYVIVKAERIDVAVALHEVVLASDGRLFRTARGQGSHRKAVLPDELRARREALGQQLYVLNRRGGDHSS